jgi:hypothetical protein
MSSSDAQKSTVHQATEDSGTEPTSDTRQSSTGVRGGSQTGSTAGGAPGADPDRDRLAEEAARLKARPDTAMGVPGNFERGAATAGVRPDTDEDTNPPGAARDETAVGKDRDESTYGGPLKIDDPTTR